MENNIIKVPKGVKAELMEDGNILLVKIEEELPKTWEECYTKLGTGYYINYCCDILNITTNDPIKVNKNILPSEAFAKYMLALSQLLVCRDIYRNGWIPNWKDSTQTKYCLSFIADNIFCSTTTIGHIILSFQTAEIRDKFVENFRALIEEAKELL